MPGLLNEIDVGVLECREGLPPRPQGLLTWPGGAQVIWPPQPGVATWSEEDLGVDLNYRWGVGAGRQAREGLPQLCRG
jgi:hypothetical protein